jgi:thioredoxin reductase (NADPH)
MSEHAFEVLIVGGGMAGLSAAVFLQRAGLKTVVFDTFESRLTEVSLVNNYLGFPDGVPGAELLKLGRKQAARFGATVKDDRVEELKVQADGSFLARDSAGETYRAARVLIASNKNVKAATDLGLALTGFKGKFIHHDGKGRTPVKNAYVCGRITEIPSQAVIAAGDGAAVAITMITDLKGEYYVDHDE